MAGLSRDEVAHAYLRYGHLVLRRCRIVLRHPQRARDALQEVFVRLLKYGESFAQARSPLAWLYRAADRVCFDMLRRLPPPERDDAFDPERHDKQGADTETTGAATAAAQAVEDRDIVLRFLRQFDERTQRVALLYFLDELAKERIAEEVGWSRQTIHAKIEQVRRRALAFKRSLGVEP